jgi:hypothetical protein
MFRRHISSIYSNRFLQKFPHGVNPAEYMRASSFLAFLLLRLFLRFFPSDRAGLPFLC